MLYNAPIIIVEDDPDDQELLVEAFNEIDIRNRLVFFRKTKEAFDFLKHSAVQPFLILSDVNMPGENGIEFKRHIDSDPQLREKSIPFVFFSTTVKKDEVDMAFKELTVQGYFKKSTEYADLKNVLKVVMDYWKICKHPNAESF